MSSNSDVPHSNPSVDRGSGQTDGASKGDNPKEDPGDICTSQTAVNQQQLSGNKEKGSHQKNFTSGPSPLSHDIEPRRDNLQSRNDDYKGKKAADQEGDFNREGGAHSGYTPVTRTGEKRTESGPDFHNLDYSGHFKINLISQESRKDVLKMETNEDQFVKFCHLFHSDLQLDAVKQALLSDLKLVVTRGGYPPSVSPQQGASAPLDTSIKCVLTCLCYQLQTVNISSTSLNIDHVKETLSSLKSYQKGIVIGYQVSGDTINYWLAGERGAMKITMDVLTQQRGAISDVVRGSQKMDKLQGDYVGDTDTDMDSRQSGQSGSDNRQTGQSGSDNRQTGQTGTDNRQTRQIRCSKTGFAL
ncbi:uncharacterized protein LOC117338988 [Pecten maximus]|uniref:uncharacterized protein LOC117338988 n=1 Tax=Pecten maximus TaxID=6579 RepID=UPI0014589A34|nr:uncharacterized protein LOC117338988 [Pecten maximus]